VLYLYGFVLLFFNFCLIQSFIFFAFHSLAQIVIKININDKDIILYLRMREVLTFDVRLFDSFFRLNKSNNIYLKIKVEKKIFLIKKISEFFEFKMLKNYS
jgi:hypothetical protein